jgi:hypothetical protein
VKRRDLKPGDCFRYVPDEDGVEYPPYVIWDDHMPWPNGRWLVSQDATAALDDDVELLESYLTHPIPTER